MRRYGTVAGGLLWASVLALVPLTAGAQDLDPTVRVSRAYEGKLLEVHKPYYRMSVPDSVERFDLTFDYSVFELPYRGTDAFEPYMLDLKPEKQAVSERTLLVRAGAGYSLHPVADVIWSPSFRGPFRMSVYATHRSYVGKYRAVGFPGFAGSSLSWTGEKYSGYDMETHAGVNGRADWNGGYFSFDIGYDGIAGRDTLLRRNYDAFRVGLRAASQKGQSKHFLYDVRLDYLFGEDKLHYLPDMEYLAEHGLVLDATIGPMLSGDHGILLDTDLDFSSYRGCLSSYAGDFSLTPRYVFDRGRWNLDLGVRLSVLFANDATEGLPVKMHGKGGQFVYPAVHASFEAIRSYMAIFADVTGGNDINTYSGQLFRNRRFAPHFAGSAYPLIDNSVERVTAALGLRGNIASRFGYSLKAGYSNFASALLDAVTLAPDTDGYRAMPSVAYAGYQMFFTGLDCEWHSEDVKAQASFMYRATDLSAANVFAPAPYTASLDVEYNWKKRIYAGIHGDFSSGRHAVSDMSQGELQLTSLRIPWYLDLGLSFEYRFSRRLSFWVYGGNLLNMTIQKVPLYAMSGASITAGVVFSL